MDKQWTFVAAPSGLWARTEEGEHHRVVLLAVQSEAYSRTMKTKALLTGTERGPGGWSKEDGCVFYFKD